MYINQLFELSMVLDHERFHQVFKHVYSEDGHMENEENEYVDKSLEEKGITVIYRDSQYRKKIKLIVNAGYLLGSGKPDPEKIVRKLNKRIGEYFGFKFKVDDLILSGMRLVMDINVGTHDEVMAYLKVFRRIGKVKGFSPVNYDCFDKKTSFCLKGNSNDVDFMIYDLKSTLVNQLKQTSIKRKDLKMIAEGSEGVLRAEVGLAKPKAIRAYVKSSDISEQIRKLTEKSREIFMDVFMQIIPMGAFYKKDRAAEIIYREVEDHILRRKMLRLLELIPAKKSLFLAQKAMDCRNIQKVMNAFAEINVSPITISKRHDKKYLKGLYEFILQK